MLNLLALLAAAAAASASAALGLEELTSCGARLELPNRAEFVAALNSGRGSRGAHQAPCCCNSNARL